MTSDAVPDGRPRLDFLHGVRGLAALTIVLFHLTLNTGPDSAGPIIRMLNVPLLHGYLAVPVFLVLSGFLLAMPVVTDGLTLRGGIRGFMRRRALRILPPYYAAYLLDMLFFAAVNRLESLLGRDPGHAVNQQIEFGYRWPSVVAHLFLVHNMKYEWQRGMDEILWTIACEWQIYLLFAIALVPIWRRGGLLAMLAVCAGLAALITYACARRWCFYLIPWMLPIFGIGAAGATVVFGAGPRAAAMRRLPWGAISSAAGAMMCVGIALLDAGVPAESMQMPAQYYHVTERFRWIYDVLAALATASLIVWLALAWRDRDASAGMAAWIRGLLESRWLQGLGRFSYSLYLTHGIVLVCVARATQWLWPHGLMHWMAVMIGGTLASLAVGYLFHVVFEKPFMSGRTWGSSSRRRATPVDVPSDSTA